MKRIFIGGSRKLGKLNHQVMVKLDSIMAHNYTVLIGDANGADKAIQTYLHRKNYDNVIVYCIENDCRNNVGNWHINLIKPPHRKRDLSFYQAKDLAMEKDSDYGFMIWDGFSKGTLHNLLNLLRNEKHTVLYFSRDKNFHTLRKVSDLRVMLTSCSFSDTERLLPMLDSITTVDNASQPLVMETSGKYEAIQPPLF